MPLLAEGTGPSRSCSSTARDAFHGVRHPVSEAASTGNIVPDRLYVTYRPATRTAQSVDEATRALRGVDLGTSHGIAHRVVTVSPGTDLARAAATLRTVPGIADVAPVHYRALTDVANDPLANDIDQWYLYRTSVQPGAWTLTHGSAAVTVAVIDTGVDQSNQDLAPKLVRAETILHGKATPGAQDTNGHGTDVAGLVGAATNNGYGFASVGYDTGLLVYKIFPDATSLCDQQLSDTADEASAILDAVDSGASVINLSLGGPASSGVDEAENFAIETAIAAGVTVVAAGGNEYPRSDGNVPDFPGGYPNVISVGASAVQDGALDRYSSITGETAAPYSNSGVMLLAPGGAAMNASDPDELHWIAGYGTTTAAFPADQCANANGPCRALFAGTSQAAPQIAGTAALMLTYHGGPHSLKPSQIATLLTSSADRLPGVARERQGAGRLNALKALTAAGQ